MEMKLKSQTRKIDKNVCSQSVHVLLKSLLSTDTHEYGNDICDMGMVNNNRDHILSPFICSRSKLIKHSGSSGCKDEMLSEQYGNIMSVVDYVKTAILL